MSGPIFELLKNICKVFIILMTIFDKFFFFPYSNLSYRYLFEYVFIGHLLNFHNKKNTRNMNFQNQTLWTIILTIIFYMDFELV
jgi:hypothetical protein